MGKQVKTENLKKAPIRRRVAKKQLGKGAVISVDDLDRGLVNVMEAEIRKNGLKYVSLDRVKKHLRK